MNSHDLPAPGERVACREIPGLFIAIIMLTGLLTGFSFPADANSVAGYLDGDGPWYDLSQWQAQDEPSPPPQTQSLYIEMEDGTKIAISTFLPADYIAGKKLPAIIRLTRYGRLHLDAHDRCCLDDPVVNFATRNGYAFVIADARGTGASFGVHRYEWSNEELRDGREIADWVRDQAWSDGRIATSGRSYPGGMAFLARDWRHPALKASITSVIGFDLYEDVFFPGGVYLEKVVSSWQGFTAWLDQNCAECGGIPSLGLGGIAPVDDDLKEHMLNRALREHNANFLVDNVLSTVQFKDDRWLDAGGRERTMHDMSLHRIARDNGAKVPMLTITGWFDGAFALGAIQRHAAFQAKGNRLVIGPWNHRWFNSSPWRNSDKSEFQFAAHYIRFLDYHLRGLKSGVENDKPFAYFTMGEEKWKFSDVWPPRGVKTKQYYLHADHKLAKEQAGEPGGYDQYEVDFSTRTGRNNRWLTIVDRQREVASYPNRNEQTEKLLTYLSNPLDKDMEVTGHPRLTAYLSVSTPDAAVHVYLEDVARDGKVRYVTEGVLRVSHRKQSDAPYPTPVVYRSHLKEDRQLLKQGEIAELVIDLLPTSYVFRAGHKVRVSIAGADASAFARIPGDGSVPVFTIHKGAGHPSRLELPVMKTKPAA